VEQEKGFTQAMTHFKKSGKLNSIHKNNNTVLGLIPHSARILLMNGNFMYNFFSCHCSE